MRLKGKASVGDGVSVTFCDAAEIWCSVTRHFMGIRNAEYVAPKLVAGGGVSGPTRALRTTA